MEGGKWIDGIGNPISGPSPLAQLGIGGQYIHPKYGTVATIVRIETMPTGHVMVVASGALPKGGA